MIIPISHWIVPIHSQEIFGSSTVNRPTQGRTKILFGGIWLLHVNRRTVQALHYHRSEAFLTTIALATVVTGLVFIRWSKPISVYPQFWLRRM